jgi:hypothetical protein
MPPSEQPQPTSPELDPAAESAAPPEYHWSQKVSAIVFIAFCLEVGLYLVIVPWTDSWERNYFSNIFATMPEYWNNVYTRGAISGLGAVNLYVSLVEIFRLRRFARH